MVDWDLIDEPWDSLGDWSKHGTGISEISPAGQLHQYNYAGRYKTGISLPSKYTFEARMKIDDYGIYGQGWEYKLGEGLKDIWIRISETEVINRSWVLSDKFLIDNVEDTWYVWRFVVDLTIPKVDIYRDGDYKHTFTQFANHFGSLIETSTLLGIEGYEDYLRIASGLHFPPTPPAVIIGKIETRKLKGKIQKRRIAENLKNRRLDGNFSKRTLSFSLAKRKMVGKWT